MGKFATQLKAKLHTPIFLLIAFAIHVRAFAQDQDTTYTKHFSQNYRVMPHLSYSTVKVRDNGATYAPNSPMAIGFGVAIKNTILDFKFGYGFIPLQSDEYGKSKTLDLQLHNFNKKWLFDFYFQHFVGFYEQFEARITLFSKMELYQFGMEATYVINNDRFSAEAAFKQSVVQLKSAGSIVVGGGAYGYRILPAELTDSINVDYIDNVQIGLNAGYTYSWVMSKHFMMSGMATLGANFGNQPTNLDEFEIKVYPTVFVRYSLAYHKDDWAVSFMVFAHNKSIYPNEFDNININNTRMELCYVKHFNRIFKKK